MRLVFEEQDLNYLVGLQVNPAKISDSTLLFGRADWTVI